MNDVFFLLKDPEDDCQDVIRMRDSDLRLRVYCLEGIDYHPPADKLVFFGDDHGTPLAFEVHSESPENFFSSIDAIRWYTQYIGYPQMEIHSEDPRQRSK
jgi:hypothetical protein